MIISAIFTLETHRIARNHGTVTGEAILGAMEARSLVVILLEGSVG